MVPTEQFVSYNDVASQTTEEYFQNNQFSIDAFNKKYALYDGETYVQALKRVCDYIASVETTEELKKYWSDRWFNEIYNDWWHPAGSIMQGAGANKNISLCNCTTISMGLLKDNEQWDNLESIIKNTSYKVAKCAAYRQGLGVDFSRLRPKKAKVLNSSNESQGAIHWMKYIDNIGYFVGQKGRIPAMLFSLSCSHPDLEEFITIKSDFTKIQNANISVQCTDGFYEAVESDSDWELFFEIPEIKIGDRIYLETESATENCIIDEKGKYYFISTKNRPYEKITKIVKARKILELIAKYMFEYAEPGLQNIDIARRYSNSDYVYNPDSNYDSRIISSNACCTTGETLILTDKGFFQIKDLVGKEVNIWNGIEFSKVIPFIAGNNQPIYKVKLSDGSYLDCTANHKWKISLDNKILDVETKELTTDMVLENYKFPIIEGGNNPSEYPYQHGFFCGDGQNNGKNSKGVLLYGEKQKLLSILDPNKTEGNILKGDRIWVSLPQEMPNKFEVPLNASIDYKIKWLAGLLDADGTIATNRSGTKSLQLSSVEYEFLYRVKLLLISLGMTSDLHLMKQEKQSLLPDGKGGKKLYNRQPIWRICISVNNTFDLVNKFGMSTYRLNLSNLIPQINKSTLNISVESVEYINTAAEVFCFTDEKNHTGCFNGIITGQSEQYLSQDSLCVLASLNAGRFNIDPIIYNQELSVIGESINRFLDNVNECELVYNTYATEKQKIAIQQLRRTGAGYTNLAAWLFKNNELYGSESGNNLVEEFTKTYNYYLYKSSIQLGKEKGSFGLFDRKKLEQSPFIQRMMSLGLEFKTLRNITNSSIAPTGTLSLMFREEVLSYGIEPGWNLYWWKRTRISGKYEYYFCVPTIVKNVFEQAGYPIPMKSNSIKDTWDGKHGKPVMEFIEKHKDIIGIKFQKATEISPIDKLNLMSQAMKWVDSSISTTYLLPENTKWEDIYQFILLANKKEVKSIAAFPDKKMYGIVSFIPFRDLAFKLKSENIDIHAQNFTDAELAELNISKTSITKTTAVKRPKELHGKLFFTKSEGKDMFVCVGLLNNDPYEIFAGFCDKQINKDKIHDLDCVITKIKQGQYKVSFEDFVIENVNDHISNNEATITRLLSLGLRHGADIKFAVDSLDKINGPLHGFSKSIGRILKKFIPDGTIISGGKCPQENCNGQLIREAGCATCQQCGWSKCG